MATSLEASSGRYWTERFGPNERLIPLLSINADDIYTTDSKTVRGYVKDAHETNAQGQEKGIYTALTLAQIGDDLLIVDGNHRFATACVLAAQDIGILPANLPEHFDFELEKTRILDGLLIADCRDNGILPADFPLNCTKEQRDELRGKLKQMGDRAVTRFAVRAKVDTEADFDSLWSLRSSALMGPHERVRFVRILEMIDRTWSKYSRWKMIPFKDALTINEDTNLDGYPFSDEEWEEGLPGNYALDLPEYINHIADMWGISKVTLRGYLELSERIHPDLIPRVRADGDLTAGEVPLVSGRILAEHLKGPSLMSLQPAVFAKSLTSRATLECLCRQTARMYPYHTDVNEILSAIDHFALQYGEEYIDTVVELIITHFDSVLKCVPLMNYDEVRQIIGRIFIRAASQNLTEKYIDRLAMHPASRLRSLAQRPGLINDQKIQETLDEINIFISAFTKESYDAYLESLRDSEDEESGSLRGKREAVAGEVNTASAEKKARVMTRYERKEELARLRSQLQLRIYSLLGMLVGRDSVPIPDRHAKALRYLIRVGRTIGTFDAEELAALDERLGNYPKEDTVSGAIDLQGVTDVRSFIAGLMEILGRYPERPPFAPKQIDELCRDLALFLEGRGA